MKKVLIVDDDITLRTALTRYLQNRGYSVQEATSGVEGLNLFEQNPPDVVVSDVLMPEMDGLEFCRRLRATRSGQLVPFIFLSTRKDVDDRVQGHQMGADDYLVKPFDPKELVAKIEAQLERSRRIHAEIIRLMQQSHFANSATPPTPPEVPPSPPQPLPLTPAEEKVFWEVIQGFTNKQIGDRLFVSPRTVQTHLSNILSKLHLESRSQLIRYAFERGYRPPAEKSEAD
ncbi:response regulator transcription factor [Leptolyngbya sp. NK1-12]|uniref:Response regulator transcription factor n=1 Tax=Leptolyngbya sp. NK1-12 TaxID=2547451 RepID=A0AA96WCT1_9CYAN|nr:response regulator transcription factor [Leptolyngbya sp. NK1-12]WNZ22853.1 response regulator transcription factor [Leptolyngbya sp. NK1-12]